MVTCILLAFLCGCLTTRAYAPLPALAEDSPYKQYENKPLLFQEIDTPGSANDAKIAKVPGGWLVWFGAGLTFLKDPNHEWRPRKN